MTKNTLPPKYKDLSKTAPFLAVVHNDKAAVTRALKENNTSFHITQNENGITPLMMAAGLGHKEIVKILCDDILTDLNRTDSNGWTALHHAAFFRQHHVYTYLMYRCADTEIKTPDGKTAFDLLHQSKLSIPQLLEKHPDADENRFYTACNTAESFTHGDWEKTILSDNPAFLNILKSFDSDKNLADEKLVTLATQNDKQNSILWLASQDTETKEKLLFQAVRDGKPQMFKTLLDSEPKIPNSFFKEDILLSGRRRRIDLAMILSMEVQHHKMWEAWSKGHPGLQQIQPRPTPNHEAVEMKKMLDDYLEKNATEADRARQRQLKKMFSR